MFKLIYLLYSFIKPPLYGITVFFIDGKIDFFKWLVIIPKKKKKRIYYMIKIILNYKIYTV